MSSVVAEADDDCDTMALPRENDVADEGGLDVRRRGGRVAYDNETAAGEAAGDWEAAEVEEVATPF